MNPVLMLTRNNIELTKRCSESVFNQTVSNTMMIVDNGSEDGTDEWFPDFLWRCSWWPLHENKGVSYGWNFGLDRLFNGKCGNQFPDHVLVINNDVFLPPWFYEDLLSYEVPFVTGISASSMEAIKDPPPRLPLVGHPDFSAFLIRREAWEKIGPFDESMKFYAQDCDYHLRAVKAGVPLLAATLPFYHERSSTLNLASVKEREEIEAQANKDRAYFLKKWRFAVGSEEYQRETQSVAGTNVPFPGEIKFLA